MKLACYSALHISTSPTANVYPFKTPLELKLYILINETKGDFYAILNGEQKEKKNNCDSPRVHQS